MRDAPFVGGDEMRTGKRKQQKGGCGARLAWQIARCLLPLLILAGAGWMEPRVVAGEPMQAGVAVVDITPPIPFRMSGYFSERLSTGIKDPLQAKAVVFTQGDQWAAMVFCDLLGISGKVSSEARARASQATGIPVEHIAITATHTHTGPLYVGALHDELHERAIRRSGNDPLDSTTYQKELVEKIARVIGEAKGSLQPVEMRSGVAREERLSFNRRFHMKDGSVRFNPGQLNPNIVRPAGPIDPQVGIVLLQRPVGDGASEAGDAEARPSDAPATRAVPFAAIVSFALHLDTVGGTEYSADYPKVVEDRLREAFGPEFTLLFASGTCGDINHIDVTTMERRSTEAIGHMLAETVVRAIRDPQCLSSSEPALAVLSEKVTWPLQKYSESELAAARKKMELVGSRELSFLDAVEATKIVDLQRWPGGNLDMEVQAFRLNRETAIVTLPAEVFVELGLAIKAASPFRTTLVMELTHECMGYIPTKKAFAEGSYEVVNSRVEPGGGERLVEAAIALLRKLE